MAWICSHDKKNELFLTIQNLLMKTIVTSLLTVCAFPAYLQAQPTLNNNEMYNVGDIVQMSNCDTTGIYPGASGAGVTWDFSLLSNNGTVSTTTIAADTSTVFLTSNLMETLPGGQTEYVQENSTDSYVNAIYDPGTGSMVYYNSYDVARRPVTYNTVYNDSFSVSIPGATPTSGRGIITQTGDAYGTLILPSGTYNNVLRVKKMQTEKDTVNATPAFYTFNSVTSYLWFDAAHAAPLLRIDSTAGSLLTTKTVMFLQGTTAVKNIKGNSVQYTAWFNDNTLQLAGNFETNNSYDLVVYDMIGAKIMEQHFSGGSNDQRFDAGRQVAPGIYMVSIANSNDPSSREIIKIVKQ